MALELKLNQKLSQTLVMTPQLQQAIKLLQLGRMEYMEVIEKELLENPVLEDDRERDRDEAEEASKSPDTADSEAERATDGAQLSADEAITFRQGSQEASDFYTDGTSAKKNYKNEEERPSVDQTVSNPEGLASHILWQLRTTELPKEDYEVAMQIVGNLDRNGYLCVPLTEIAEDTCREVADVERILGVVQTLDPAGIAARDLRECLLIQLEQIGQTGTLCWNLVDKHLPLLEAKNYSQIAKLEEVVVEDVYQAVKQILKLEPRPGRPFVDEAPIYITPDVYVRKVGDDYVISLNENGMPKLKLNAQYQELLKNGVEKSSPDKEYLLDRVRSATWLIKSIEQRQQTIYRVTESIMKHQHQFLEKGVSALKPLVLRDIASDVGMHESTISRVTTNKYVHTPRGVFELKFFFTSGLKSGAGEVSSESVKERIRQLISEENPKKPLSDQSIVNSLKAEGVDIARRTVAKYREMMNILSSSRRKKAF